MIDIMDSSSTIDRRFADDLPVSEVRRLQTLYARTRTAEKQARDRRLILKATVRSLLARGRSATKIAEALGVTRQTVYKIADGE